VFAKNGDPESKTGAHGREEGLETKERWAPESELVSGAPKLEGHGVTKS